MRQRRAEGMDAAVLRAFLAVPGFRPGGIVFEQQLLTAAEKRAIRGLLAEHGYGLAPRDYRLVSTMPRAYDHAHGRWARLRDATVEESLDDHLSTQKSSSPSSAGISSGSGRISGGPPM